MEPSGHRHPRRLRPLNRSRHRRRPVLKAVAAVAAVVVAAGGIVAVSIYRGALRSNVGELAFENRLLVPALAPSASDGAGRRVFDLTVGAGRARLLGGPTTATWGFNGPYLGPTMRASRGDTVTVNVTNELNQTTTVHWHGMHLPAAMDGGPHQPIEPGATWSATWTVDQPAATLWYHAHPEGRTGDHVYRGLAGLFLVDDPGAGTSALPERYGVDDIPVIVQDKVFTDDGQLDRSGTRFSPIGILGDEILVNGTYDPYLPVQSTRVRLRLLNAANSRTFNLGFADDRQFAAVATDAGLLAAPVSVSRLLLAPSERAEVVLELAPGERVTLRGFPTGIGGGNRPSRFAGGDDSFDVLRLVAADRLEPSVPVLDRLPAPPAVVAEAGAPRRLFEFNHASRINGRPFDPERVDFTVRPGSTEVWELRNGSDNQHVFHVHGVSFSILEYDGRSPPAHLAGLKDSVFLPPGTSATVAVRFGTQVDPRTPYVFHCHLLAHEDHGMMGQYLVSES